MHEKKHGNDNKSANYSPLVTSDDLNNSNIDLDNVYTVVEDIPMLREDLQRLLADSNAEMEMVKSMAEDPTIKANPETAKIFKGVIANAEADRLAILARTRVDRRKKNLERRDIPQTVTALVRDYVLNSAAPFTVKMAMDSIRPKTASRVSESAVSQALRRMTGEEVEVAQQGIGPAPTYYRKKSAEAQVVRMVLEDENGHGSSVDEIGEKTGYAVQVVRRILIEHPEMFAEGTDHRWRKKN